MILKQHHIISVIVIIMATSAQVQGWFDVTHGITHSSCKSNEVAQKCSCSNPLNCVRSYFMNDTCTAEYTNKLGQMAVVTCKRASESNKKYININGTGVSCPRGSTDVYHTYLKPWRLEVRPKASEGCKYDLCQRRCRLHYCGEPGEGLNSFVKGSYYVNDTATYSCQPGYFGPKGVLRKVVTCQPNGFLDTEPLHCPDQELKSVYRKRMSERECASMCSAQEMPKCGRFEMAKDACTLVAEKPLQYPPSCGLGMYKLIWTHSNGCPPRFSHSLLFEDVDSCYKYLPVAVNWYRANDVCSRYSSVLASIETEGEQRHLERMLKEMDSLEYIYTSGKGRYLKFRWTATNSPVSYLNWQPNEPNNGKEACIALRTGYSYRWIDSACMEARSVLCEIKLQTKDEYMRKQK